MATNSTQVTIKPLNIGTVTVTIAGTAPYVQNRFSQKALNILHEKHAAGSQAKSKKVREAKDFDACYEGALHTFEDGTPGIPAVAFRCAMIDACRLVGFQMTKAKCSIFVKADGLDVVDGTPLVKIMGTPEYSEMMTRNADGKPDLRARPMWRQWTATVKIAFDQDQFSASDVLNLLLRAGAQVGIGEGRPFSKNSAGMGWGTFELAEEAK